MFYVCNKKSPKEKSVSKIIKLAKAFVCWFAKL